MNVYAMVSEVAQTTDSIGTLEKIMNSSVISWVLAGVVLYIAILWIAIILWVTKDITNRTNNVALQIVCISLVIFLTPIFGLVMYLIVRPGKTLIERYYEEFELDLINDEEQSKEVEHCPYCTAKTETSFNFCTVCAKEIVKHCTGCKKNVRVNWAACPYCGHAQEDVVKSAPETLTTEVKKRKKSQEKEMNALPESENSTETQTPA